MRAAHRCVAVVVNSYKRRVGPVLGLVSPGLVGGVASGGVWFGVFVNLLYLVRYLMRNRRRPLLHLAK